MSEIKLIVRPFAMGTEKEAANKVQEEANEAVHAWRSFVDVLYPITTAQEPSTCMLESTHTRLADEIADTIQASCNLAARYGIDLQAAMERCEQKNRSRGRYPMEEKHVESCGVHDGHDCNCGGSCGAAPVGVDNLPKSPEDMSVEELIKALYLTNGYRYTIDEHGFLRGGSCKETLGDDWCDRHDTCRDCRNHLLCLLKAEYEREIEKVRADTTCNIARGEIAEMQRQIDDLTHERDGLRNRLAELNEAGIARLHRLLREAMGEAKNVTHNARVYIDEQKGSNNELCGSDSGRDSCVCGVERAGERVLSEEPPAQEMSEREKIVERLREIDFAQKNVYLSDIGCAVIGRNPSSWWSDESRAALRDKLIELIGEGGAE